MKDSSDSSDPSDGATTAVKSPESQTGPVTNWITKRDRHMQLINSAVYNQEIEARSKAIEHTRRQKTFERDLREKQKLQRHFETLIPNTYHGTLPLVSDASLPAYTLNIDGLYFQVGKNGSKLSRVFSMSDVVVIHPVLNNSQMTQTNHAQLLRGPLWEVLRLYEVRTEISTDLVL